jgi:hypothetical protein
MSLADGVLMGLAASNEYRCMYVCQKCFLANPSMILVDMHYLHRRPEMEVQIFYALEGLSYKLELENNTFSHSLTRLQDDVKRMRENYIRKACALLAYYLLGIAAGEARHTEKVRDKTRIKGITKTLNRWEAWTKSDNYQRRHLAEALTELFNEHEWSNSSYGGKKWGSIANHALEYYTSDQDLGFLVAWLDTLWGLQHNGGRLFDKGYLFQSSHDTAMRHLLDFNKLGYLRVAYLPQHYANLFNRADTLGLEGVLYAVNNGSTSLVDTYILPDEGKKIASCFQPPTFTCHRCGVERLTRRSLLVGLDKHLYCKSCASAVFTTCRKCKTPILKEAAHRVYQNWKSTYYCTECISTVTVCKHCGSEIVEPRDWPVEISTLSHPDRAKLVQELARLPTLCSSCYWLLYHKVEREAQLRQKLGPQIQIEKEKNGNSDTGEQGEHKSEYTSNDYDENLSHLAKKSV